MNLTGMLLWDLAGCAEMLETIEADDLLTILNEAEAWGTKTHRDAMGVVYTATPKTWEFVRALLLSTHPTMPALWAWEGAEVAREQALNALPDEPLPDGLRVAALSEALAFLLSLDLDSVRDACPTDAERADADDALRRVEQLLDQFERKVNHRGQWPR